MFTDPEMKVTTLVIPTSTDGALPIEGRIIRVLEIA
jgi:hypothetical protein